MDCCRPDSSTALRIRAGFVDITPPRPVPLAGFAGRTEPCQGIADPLEAAAVIIDDGNRRVALVSFDLLYVGAELRKRLERELAPWLAPAELFLAASHTHSAPATDTTLPLLGIADGDYVAMVAARVSALLVDLLRSAPMPLQAGIATGRVANTVNRRCRGWRLGRRFPFVRRAVGMHANPIGPRDDTVTIVRLGPKVVLWHYACHPVFFPQWNHVSADYVGVVRSALRRHFGKDLTVLFWQGFSGNLFPSFAPPSPGLVRSVAQRLCTKPFLPVGSVWQSWAEHLAGRVVALASAAPVHAAHGPVKAARAAIPLQQLLGPDASARTICAQRITVGNLIDVVGLSAEAMVEYVALLRQFFGNDRLLCVNCIDDVYGYLPTSHMLAEGGYEAEDFLPLFSSRGRFRPGIECALTEQLLTPLRPRAIETAA